MSGYQPLYNDTERLVSDILNNRGIGTQGYNTPGINPSAPPVVTPMSNPMGGIGSAQKTPQTGLDALLQRPSGMFLANLLAQSGYSTMPQSPVGAIGRAMLGTQQGMQQNRRIGLQEQLLQSRLGLQGQANTNVQSTFKGSNGNMWLVTRDGQTKDTGVPYSTNVRLFEQADGSVKAVNTATGEEMGQPITPDEAAEATTRKRQTEAAFELPAELAGLDSVLRKTDETMGKLDDVIALVRPGTVGLDATLRSNLPGFLGGDVRQLNQAIKSLSANLGFDTLQEMRAASKTGGALGQVSERELDLLINAVQSLDQEGDPEVLRENLQKVKFHYENYKREIDKMKQIMREQAGQGGDEFEGFSIAE